MKAKLLLAILPAFGLLAGCSGETKPKEFLEEADACQEVFGGDEVAFEKKGRKQLTSDDFVQPAIGIQYKRYEEDHDENGENEVYYAIRYVAAVASIDPTMTWTRAVTQVSGYKVKGMSARPTVTKFYNSLFDVDGSKIYPSSYGSGYKSFVAYTMYDIPEAQANSYMIAYLTLSDPSSEIGSVSSLAVVSQIAKNGKVFSVDANAEGFFMGGTINGVPNTSRLLPGNSSDNGVLLNVLLNKDEQVGFFSKNSSEFAFYGFSNSAFNKAGANIATGVDGSSFFNIKQTGVYNFYINKSNELWPSDVTSTRRIYNLKLGASATPNQIIMIHSWGAADEDQLLFNGQEKVSPTAFSVPNTATGYLFARLKPGETTYGDEWANVDIQFNGKFLSDDLASNAATPTIVYSTDGSSHWSEVAFYSGSLTFSVTHDAGANNAIYLLGTMHGENDWKQAVGEESIMTNDGENNWSITINISAGKQQYKYVIAANNATSSSALDWDTLQQDGKNREITIL